MTLAGTNKIELSREKQHSTAQFDFQQLTIADAVIKILVKFIVSRPEMIGARVIASHLADLDYLYMLYSLQPHQLKLQPGADHDWHFVHPTVRSSSDRPEASEGAAGVALFLPTAFRIVLAAGALPTTWGIRKSHFASGVRLSRPNSWSCNSSPAISLSLCSCQSIRETICISFSQEDPSNGFGNEIAKRAQTSQAIR